MAPAPPDYGGVMDVYYKVKALAATGMRIHLHYFQYKAGRGHQALEPFCQTIQAYPRKTFAQCLPSPRPYIVASRINKNLIKNLNEDAHPVLLEGIHCSGLLPYLRKDKKVTVRLHNNEALYYAGLAQTETHLLRNLYYSMEATRLERYQKALSHQISCAALSATDLRFFEDRLGWNKMLFAPLFVPWQQVVSKEGIGSFCLYHGNLSVPENKAAVKWLMQHVFAGTDISFVVAGKAPDAKLKQWMAKFPNTRLVADPHDAELEELIQDAQINILPSMNRTGVKLKLLHALFSGRHCISNSAGVAGSELEAAVHICEDAAGLKALVSRLMQQPFTEAEKKQRRDLLQLYNNSTNAAALSAWIC